jgi:hypothetical protein
MLSLVNQSGCACSTFTPRQGNLDARFPSLHLLDQAATVGSGVTDQHGIDLYARIVVHFAMVGNDEAPNRSSGKSTGR